MSDTTNSPKPTDEARTEALNWLAGQFRWESLLEDLHELAETQGAPLTELESRDDRDNDACDEESAA